MKTPFTTVQLTCDFEMRACCSLLSSEKSLQQNYSSSMASIISRQTVRAKCFRIFQTGISFTRDSHFRSCSGRNLKSVPCNESEPFTRDRSFAHPYLRMSSLLHAHPTMWLLPHHRKGDIGSFCLSPVGSSVHRGAWFTNDQVGCQLNARMVQRLLRNLAQQHGRRDTPHLRRPGSSTSIIPLPPFRTRFSARFCINPLSRMICSTRSRVFGATSGR